MATDPFADIQRPIRGEYQEISQSTFVELISARRELIRPAFRPPTPSVVNSLARIAFGRTCAGTTNDPAFPGQIIATPQHTNNLSYSLKAEPTAYHKKAAGLAAAKSSQDLRSMVFNSQDIDAYVCPEPIDEPCLVRPCPIDLVLVLNNSRIMMPVWDNVKASIEQFVVMLANVVNENMRLGIVTFQDFITNHRYLWYTHVAGETKYQCIDALDGFISVLRRLEMVGPYEGGIDIPDWSALAVKHVLDGNVGHWRAATRIILLVTAVPNNNDTGLYIEEAANLAAGCDVIVPFILVPALQYWTPTPDPSYTAAMQYEGTACERITGGPFVIANDDGTGIKEGLETWAHSLCEASNVCVPGPDDVCAVDLAVVLDDTSSMSGVISTVKAGIASVVNILKDAIGLNFRLALVTFKDDVTLRYEFGPCGLESVNGFTSALEDVFASGGGGLAEYSAAAVKFAAEGNAGAWRTDCLRAILLVTDAPNNTASGISYTQAAQIAAENNIRVAYAATPAKVLIMRTEGETYATTTSGIFVETSATGDNLPQLLTSWIYGLCAASIPPRECEGGVDRIINGTFDVGIGGWTTYKEPVSWSSTKQAMYIVNRLGVGGEARQTITGLTPGDRLVLSASIEAAQSGTMWYGVTFFTENKTLAAGETTRITCSVDVPESGEVTVLFASDEPTGAFFYVDNVVACVYKVDECGPGSRNLVNNPNFVSGVEYWTDASDTALPTTSTLVWDSEILAIVVNISEYDEVRTAVDVTPGREYVLSFQIISSEPSEISEISLKYGILDDSNVIVTEGEITNADLTTLPKNITLTFVGPDNGVAKIFFKVGAIGGVTKISSVLICDQVGICEPGYTRLSFDDFTSGSGGWGGGVVEDGKLKIFQFPGGGFPGAGQLYSGLEPGAIVSITLTLKSAASGVIEMTSGGVVDQLVIGPTMGLYTLESTVQSSGSIYIHISHDLNNILYVDDILVCVKDAIDCTNNVSGLKAFIEWQGVPRKPFNVFNAAIRYNVRTIVDSSPVITSYTYLPTTEGHTGIATSCDFWKQQGSNGTADSAILKNGVSELILPDIEDGDFASVASKINWLWSVPWGGDAGLDNLIINFPSPPPDVLVESVTIFLLSQYCQPVGANTTPVLAPPLSCATDPAVNVGVGITYTNYAGLKREFITSKHINELWWQDVDFETHLPDTWDNRSALNYGIKGDIARWDAYTFVLDSVDGTGLDQCSTPIDFNESSTKGQLNFNKFTLTGTAVFSTEPIILPVVPGPPYKYDIPVCTPVEDPCDLSSLSCQSGPLLCRPGEGDVIAEPEACCNEANMPDAVNHANFLCLQRDLFDPYRNGCCGAATTIRDLAVRKGLNPNEYNPYIRDWETNTLSNATYSQAIKIGQSIVLVENELDTESGRASVLQHLSTHREILPNRMYWPRGEF